jgi:hypothetical protein
VPGRDRVEALPLAGRYGTHGASARPGSARWTHGGTTRGPGGQCHNLHMTRGGRDDGGKEQPDKEQGHSTWIQTESIRKTGEREGLEKKEGR